MTSLTVLQVHNRYREAGGEDTVVAAEAALLRVAGHVVIQHIMQNPGGSLRSAASLLTSPWNPRSARELTSLARRIRPDVAHVHNTWWALSPSVVRSLSRLDIPVVVTLHNYRLLCANAKLFRDGHPCEDCVESHPWHAVQHRCYRDSIPASAAAAATISVQQRLSTWQAADVLLPLTEFARDRFIAGGLPPEKLLVKPNFVADPGPRSIRPSEGATVLYVGRLSPEKGIETLLDAWRQAALDGLELVVVGDGPLQAAVRASAPPGVRLVGRLGSGEVRDLMLNARAIVFPSVCYEGQPMVLLEALAAGLPLVVSNVGGIPDTVNATKTAVVAEPGDRSGWAATLGALSDGAWLDAAGRHARDVFEARYAPDRALETLLDVYRSAIDAHSG